MDGHLYQRGKGKTWYLLYDLPTRPGEKRHQRKQRIGQMSRTQAEARKREILRTVDESVWMEERSSLTVETFLTSWLETTRDRLAPTTHARYADLVNRHVIPVIGRRRLAKLTPEHIREVYSSVRAKGLSGRTCLHVHRVLHTAFAYGVREERLMTENVISRVPAPRVEDTELQPVSEERIRLLIEAARGSRLEVPIILAAVTGLRRGEVLALRWRNIDLDKQSLFVTESLEQTREFGVRFKSPKSKSSKRFVPLSPEVVAVLRTHKAGQDAIRSQHAPEYYEKHDLEFCNDDGSPWPPDTLSSQFGKLAALVGLKGFRFHDLRHGFASIALANGVSIKEVSTLMGHSSPTVTLTVYARSMEGLGRQAVNGLAQSLLVPRGT